MLIFTFAAAQRKAACAKNPAEAASEMALTFPIERQSLPGS